MTNVFTILLLLISFVCNSQIALPGTKYVSSGLLLDTYTSAAGAWSGARKLRTAYAGSIIRVRRSNDNAEQDIGFVNNLLDTASLKTFVGANSGYITICYDQSGNSLNAANATLLQQPQIVAAGVVLRANGQPTISFGTESDSWGLLIPTGFLNAATTLSYFQVATVTDYASSNAGVFGPANTNTTGMQILQVSVISRPTYLSFNSEAARNNNAGAGYQMWNDAAQSITSVHGNTTSVGVFKNGSAITLTNSAAMPTLNYNGIYAIGFYNGSGNDMKGNINEVVIYTSNQTSNRGGIETNMRNFYLTY